MIADKYIDRKPPVEVAADWLATYAKMWRLERSEHEQPRYEIGGEPEHRYTVTLVHLTIPDTTLIGTGSTIMLAMMHALGLGDE